MHACTGLGSIEGGQTHVSPQCIGKSNAVGRLAPSCCWWGQQHSNKGALAMCGEMPVTRCVHPNMKVSTPMHVIRICTLSTRSMPPLFPRTDSSVATCAVAITPLFEMIKSSFCIRSHFRISCINVVSAHVVCTCPDGLVVYGMQLVPDRNGPSKYVLFPHCCFLAMRS